MGYPVAYRTGLARAERRLSREPTPIAPMRRGANDNRRAPSPDDLRRKADDALRKLQKPPKIKMPEVPPQPKSGGLGDVGAYAELLIRLLLRNTLFGRLMDIGELLRIFDEWYRGSRFGNGIPGGWHVDFMNGSHPINQSFWDTQTAMGFPPGPPTISYVAGGGHVPDFLWSFFHSPVADPWVAGEIWGYVLLPRTDGVNQGEIVGGIHADVVPSSPPVVTPQLYWEPMTERSILSRYRWANPLEWTPLVEPALDPVPPPVNIPRRLDPRRDPQLNPFNESGYDLAPSFVPVSGRPTSIDIGVPRPVSPPVGRKPPGKRVKERKFKAKTLTNIIASALKSGAYVHGKMTDLRDLIKALHDALPKEVQVKGKDKKRIVALFRAVYENIDKIDDSEIEITRWKGTPWETKLRVSRKQAAFENILEEVLQDILGGFGDKLRTKAAAKNRWFKNKIFTSPRF